MLSLGETEIDGDIEEELADEELSEREPGLFDAKEDDVMIELGALESGDWLLSISNVDW